MYESIIVTLILVADIYGIYMNHKKRERTSIRRTVTRTLHALGLR